MTLDVGIQNMLGQANYNKWQGKKQATLPKSTGSSYGIIDEYHNHFP